MPTKPVGLMDVSRFPHLIAELIRSGWSDDAVASIASQNFVRVWRAVDQEGERLRRDTPPALGTVADYDRPAAPSA